MSEESSAAVLEINNSSEIPYNRELIDEFLTQNEASTEESAERTIIESRNFELCAEEDDLDGFISDLKVVVDGPQRHAEAFETYISYRITVNTSRPEYSENNYTVRRRYNDFFWLRNKLVETYSTRLIPSLPGKHSLLGHLDRYAKDFIMIRMLMLHRFLNRVVKHPILSCSEHLKVFLTAGLIELSSYQKQSNLGILTKVAGGIYNVTSMCTIKDKCPEFEEVKKYIILLIEKLNSFEKIICRMYKERRELTKEMIHLSLEFEKWAGSEFNLSPLLLSVSQALSNISTIHDTLLVNSLEFVVLLPIKEYLLYTESVKEALIRRDMLHAQYESCIEELHKKKSDQVSNIDDKRFSMWKNSDKHEQLVSSSEISPKLISTLEANHDKLQVANEDLRSDLERWNFEKKNDVKRMLLALSDHYIQYYQKSLTIWEENLKKINVPLDEEM